MQFNELKNCTSEADGLFNDLHYLNNTDKTSGTE